MVQWLLSAHGRCLAALTALGALSACATPPAEHAAETAAGGWHVVERVGQARYSPPDAAVWLSAITGQPIIDGSEVTTGRGGRLILAMPGRHISAGPSSRFLLPRPDWDNRLEQRAGWLRYRVATAGGEPFRVRTRSLDLEFAAAVLDVRVEQDAIDVTVKEGEVRLATPDGLRRTEIAAGQSAQAGGIGGAQLAVRRAPQDPLEPVDPLIIPAIQPAPTMTVAPATDRPPLAQDAVEPKAAVLPSARDQVDQNVTIAPRPHAAIALAPAHTPPEAHEGVRSAERTAAHPPAGAEASHELLAAADRRAPVSVARTVDPVRFPTGRRGKFERLTEGMIDGVPGFNLRVLIR